MILARLLLAAVLVPLLLCEAASAQQRYTIAVLPFDLVLGDSVRAINNRGQVLGNNHVWRNGTVTLLEIPPSRAAYSHCLADNDDVCGFFDQDHEEHAFYSTGGTAVDLGGFLWRRRNARAAINCIASNLNNVGQVVGTAGNRDGEMPCAALWQDGKLQKLADLIPTGTTWKLEQAASVNDAGQIVGVGRVCGRFHTFLLTPIILP